MSDQPIHYHKPAPKPYAFARPLTFGVYYTTPTFRAIEQHSCVCFSDDMGLVASTGRANDEESQRYAELFALAPKMLELLLALQDDPEALLADEAHSKSLHAILSELGYL